jgi:predicted outer membrane repeat protein
MKNDKIKLHKVLSPLVFLCFIVLAPILGGCSFFMLNDGEDEPKDGEEPAPIEFSENYSFDEALQWILDLLNTNPPAGEARFIIFLNEDINLTAPINLSLSQPDPPSLEIILRGRDGVREITGSAGSSFFIVGNRVTLTLLDNLRLRGSPSGTAPLITVNPGGKFALFNAEITGNKNTAAGGAVYIADGAGAADADRGTFIMNGGTIHDNTALNGGAVYIGEYGEFAFYGGTLYDNNAGSGGAVYIGNDGKFILAGIGALKNNTAQTNGGGVCGTGIFTMTDGTIENNAAAAGSGGGVYMSAGGTFAMRAGTIKNNTAQTNGGGVCVDTAFSLEGGDIEDNAAAAGGGGVYMPAGGAFAMRAGTIKNNTAGSDGGGVYAPAAFTLEGGAIESNLANAASGKGGGVYLPAAGTFDMRNGVISANTAAAGGGVYVEDGVFKMSGGARITAEADNKVYLVSGKLITLGTKGFTGDPSHIATIDPADNAAGAQVLDEEPPSSGWIVVYKDRFTVAGWIIGDDGKLALPPP